MKKKLLISLFSKIPFWNAPTYFIEKLRNVLEPFGYEVIVSESKKDYLKKVRESEILICWKVKSEDLRNTTIKHVIFAKAGYPEGFNRNDFEKNIKFSFFPGFNKEYVAEYTIGLIFYLLKKYYLFYKKNNIWDLKKEVFPETLKNKTITILGLGNVGLEIARLLNGFNVHIYGVKRNPISSSYVEKIYHPINIYEPLAQSDIVISTLPLNESTRHSIGEKEFFSIKKGGYFINVSRGGVIMEKALIKAIQEKHLSAAALDVFQLEPLPLDHPFFNYSNIIITPHVAGTFKEYWDVLYEHLKKILLEK